MFRPTVPTFKLYKEIENHLFRNIRIRVMSSITL
jgi:hypothetical protein